MTDNHEDPIISRLKPLDGGRILDVATGFGDFLKLLTDSFGRFSEAIGIDFERRVTEASKKHDDPSLQYRVMDAEAMDFPGGYFDTVAIRHSLHHLTNPGPVLAEMTRVLKPGGLMLIGEVFQDPATERPNSQRHFHHFWAEADQVFGIPHYETLTREQILEMIDGLKLETEEVIDYFEESSEEEAREAIDFMLKYTEELVEKLRTEGGHDSLAAKGERLAGVLREQGYTDEGMVYVLARKPR